MTTFALPTLRYPNGSPCLRSEAARTILAIAGSLFALAGATLAIAGSMSPDGESFYLFAGFGLIVSGALLARRRMAGVWTYLAMTAVTLVWSLQPGESSLAYRLIGPIVLLAMISILLPALGRRTSRAMADCAAAIPSSPAGARQ